MCANDDVDMLSLDRNRWRRGEESRAQWKREEKKPLPGVENSQGAVYIYTYTQYDEPK